MDRRTPWPVRWKAWACLASLAAASALLLAGALGLLPGLGSGDGTDEGRVGALREAGSAPRPEGSPGAAGELPGARLCGRDPAPGGEGRAPGGGLSTGDEEALTAGEADDQGFVELPLEDDVGWQTSEDAEEEDGPWADDLPPTAPRARVGTTARWTDDEPVYTIAFTPDARRVVSAGESSVLVVREVDTGRVVGRLLGHGAGGVSDAEVGPDGRQVLSGGYDGSARLWDLTTLQELRVLEVGDGTVYHVGFDPGGGRAITAGDQGAVLLWDLGTGDVLQRLDLGDTGYCARLSPDGGALAAVTSGGLLRVWDARTWQLAFDVQAHAGAAGEVVFLPDGDRLVTCGEDGMVKVWERATGALAHGWKAHDARISELALSPDASTVATGGWEGRVKHWRLADGTLLWDREGHKDLVVAMAFSGDGRTVASGARDGVTCLWDAETGEPASLDPEPLEGHRGAVLDLVFAGDRLVSSGQDRTIRVWDLATREWTLLLRMPGAPAASLDAEAAGERLLAGGDAGAALFDLATGDVRWSSGPGEGGLAPLAVGPAARTVLGLERPGGGLWIRGLGTGRGEARQAGPFAGLAVLPSQGLVAALRPPAAVDVLWLDGTLVRTLVLISERPDGPCALAWFPDGLSLVVAEERGAVRMAAADGRTIARYRTRGEVLDVAVTPDAGRVVLATAEDDAACFDAATGEPLRRYASHHGPVTCVAVSWDGRTVATAGSDGAIYLWDLAD